MAMDGSGLSASDVLALTKDNDGLFGGGSAGGILALIIVFILLFGNGGWGGYGNRENLATQGEIQRGFDTNTIINKLEGISNGICSLGYDQLAQMNGINMNIVQSANGINNGIAQLGFNMQNCCCETNRNIDAVRYENAQNTCAIVNAIHADGEATRDLIQADTIQKLRDKVQEQQNTISNFMQTQNILNSIGRYVTNPPCYQNYGYGYGNYGCGCGCGTTIA